MQQWDLNLIIRLQEALRTPFLDYLFYIISFIGTEYVFLTAVLIIYWCFNKRFAYKFFYVYMAGSLLTGVIKTVVARPRPYKCGADSVISETSGFSFPSGHSQSIANIAAQFSLCAYKTKNKKLFVRVAAVGAAVAALVMFSRMYLGQHYLTDVVAGAALGILSVLLLSMLFGLLKNKEERLFYVILPITVVLAAVLVGTGKNPTDLIGLLGVMAAMSLGYFLEKRYVGYDVKSGALWKQIVKVVTGILVVLLLKEGLYFLFKAAGATGRLLMFAEFLCYFLTGFFASFIAPMVFKRIKL